MRDDQRISFEDLFQMPLDDIDGKLEFEEDEKKRSGTDQFSDFHTEMHEAIVEYYINCMKAVKLADNAPRAIRLGYDSCKAKYRKVLRENVNWEMLYIIGRLGEMTSEFLNNINNGENQLGIPKIIGIGPGGVQVINGGDVPPEIMEQIKKFAMDMTKRIVEQDGDDPGDLKNILKQKPPAPPEKKIRTEKTQEEISRDADDMIDKALNNKNKESDQK